MSFCMTAVAQFILQHGYSILFAAVFARQVGFPVPAPLFLLAAGALAAAGKLGLIAVLALTVSACVLADWGWYEAGRGGGDRVLHFLHRFTRDPDAHNRKAKEIFARHGPPLLLLAKFVPGLDAVMPPLAGTSRTGRLRFLAFDTVGATLYAGAYTGLGGLFSHDLNRAAAYSGRAGMLLTGLSVAALSVYAARKRIRPPRLTPEFGGLRITPNPLELDGSAVKEGLSHGD